MPIIKLTQQFINNNLQCPEAKSRIEYCDSELPGLYVEGRATSQGQGTYYLRYKDSTGKTCHQKIARTTDISLVEARKRAKTLKAEIALGSDPRGEEKARKAVLTFDELFQLYLEHIRLRKRSWRRDEELYRIRIKKVFGQLKINQISRQQIQSFHTALREENLAPSTCNHHAKLLRQVFNTGIAWSLVDTNPAAKIPLFYEDNKIQNLLTEDQLGRLLRILETDKNRTVCQICMLLLCMGNRLQEILSAKWGDIDLDKRVFIVRATNSKSKRLRPVPLNDSAMEILHQLEKKSEYLFINKKTGKPYTTIHRVWLRLRSAAGLDFLRVHDLRHNFAALVINNAQNPSLYTLQQLLEHSSPTVTQRYAHLTTKTLQEAAQSASVKIKQASGQST